jgi:hypothetical protein
LAWYLPAFVSDERFLLFFFFQIVLPPHLERIRERLAENIHELWVMNKIELGWQYGPVYDFEIYPQILFINHLER